VLDHSRDVVVELPPVFLLHLHDQLSVELLKITDHPSVIVDAISDELTNHQVVDVATEPGESLFGVVGPNKVHETARVGQKHQVLVVRHHRLHSPLADGSAPTRLA
jgi:hypothetical protein